MPRTPVRRLASVLRRVAARLVPLSLRRRLLNTPEKRLLHYDLDNGALVLSGEVRQSGWVVRSVQLVARGDGASTRIANRTPAGAAFAVTVDLEAVQRELGITSDVVDLWLDLGPASGSARTVRLRLGKFDRTVRPQHKLETTVAGNPVSTMVTGPGNLSLQFGVGEERRALVTTERLRRRDSVLDLTLTLSTSNTTLEGASLLALGRQSQVRHLVPASFVPLPERSAPAHGRLIGRLEACLDIDALKAAMPPDEETVDLFVVCNPGAPDETMSRVPGRRGLLGRRLHSLDSSHGGLTTLFVPYLTFRTKSLSYRIEHFATADYQYLVRLSRIAWIFTLTRPFTRIWLIGEVPYKAQDNGYHFFRHMRTQHPRRRAYYVIDAESPDRQKVEELGNVVVRFSRQHIRYTMEASRFVGSHHAEYLFASRDRRAMRSTRGVRVFLQHGPTATKNVVPNYGRQGTAERPTERFIVTSELERRIIVEDYGYRPHQVSVAGFARFDALFADDVERERTVLVMPTWRDDLMVEETFLASEYFANWHGLLQSPELHELLEDAGLEVKLVLHPNMRRYAHHFESPRVRVLRPDEADVQRLLKSSSVLVTDFSSVSWDFSYLRRPVLFFQFDRANLVSARAPHIDLDESLPGPIVRRPAELIAELRATVERDLQMEDEYYTRARAFLTYADRDNCARIYDVVNGSWNAKVAFERVRNNENVQLAWRVYRRSAYYFPTMRLVNRIGRLLPRTDVVLFECDRGMGYGDSPRYLYERLIARDHGLQIVWANNTTLRLTDEHTRKVRRHSPSYWWIASRARYLVSNQNFPADLKPARRTRYLQTWHGTPLKKMQHDVEQMIGRDADYQDRAARMTSYWSALVSASDYASQAFRSAFRYTGPILELGYPRNDVFAWPGRDRRVARVRSWLGIPDDNRRVVLYAPTFRDDERDGVHWRQQLVIDLARLQAELGDRFILLVRFHQLVRDQLPPEFFSSNFVIDASRYPDVQELLMASDVLVTDYSSLFFDFAALDKPVVFFAYDLDRYRTDLRGFYLDYESQVPGPIATTNDELVRVLDNLDEEWGPFAPRLDAFRARFGPLDDGGASDRVLDAFFGPVIGTAPDDLALPATVRASSGPQGSAHTSTK